MCGQIGHVTPEAFDGGPLALIEDGDVVDIDTKKKTLDVMLSAEILVERRKVS